MQDVGLHRAGGHQVALVAVAIAQEEGLGEPPAVIEGRKLDADQGRSEKPLLDLRIHAEFNATAGFRRPLARRFKLRQRAVGGSVGVVNQSKQLWHRPLP